MTGAILSAEDVRAAIGGLASFPATIEGPGWTAEGTARIFRWPDRGARSYGGSFVSPRFVVTEAFLLDPPQGDAVLRFGDIALPVAWSIAELMRGGRVVFASTGEPRIAIPDPLSPG